MTKTKDTFKESISELHGNLIVTYEEGDRLGNVGDIYFDKKSCGIKGISLSSKLLEPEAKNFIKFKDIFKLGNSVVIVSKKSAVGTMPKGLESSCLRLLKGIRLVTQDGENLGELSDVSVDEKSGTIQEVTLFGDKSIRIDVEKDKIQIGRDMIVVPSAYKANITANAKQSEDKLSQVVKSAEKVTRRFADSINEAVHKVAAASKSYSGRGQAKEGEGVEAESKKTSDASSESTGVASKEGASRKKASGKATAKKKAAKKAPAKKAAKKAASKKTATKST